MMIITKVFRLESSDETSVQVGVIENIQADSLLFTWDSSLLLSAYIVSNKHLFDNASILEIGAGVGLPALTCAHPALRAKRVIITERSEEQDTLRNLQRLVDLNGVAEVCSVQPLSWDQPATWPQQDQYHLQHSNSHPHYKHEAQGKGGFDYILGSDVLYSTEDFVPLLALLEHLFLLNPRAVFLTTYKNRSSRRTLTPHLQMHGMRAEAVPLDSFLPSCHHRTGVCVFETDTFEEMTQQTPAAPSLDAIAAAAAAAAAASVTAATGEAVNDRHSDSHSSSGSDSDKLWGESCDSYVHEEERNDDTAAAGLGQESRRKRRRKTKDMASSMHCGSSSSSSSMTGSSMIDGSSSSSGSSSVCSHEQQPVTATNTTIVADTTTSPPPRQQQQQEVSSKQQVAGQHSSPPPEYSLKSVSVFDETYMLKIQLI